MTSALSFELVIIAVAVSAAGFILLGIFYPPIARYLGMDEGTPGHRFLSVVIGLALFALVLVYRFARSGMTVI